MHDTVIALQIISDAKKKTPGKKINGITLEVGELAPVETHEIKHTLATLSGWKVNATGGKALVACSCGFKGKPKILERGHDFVLFVCPRCGAVPKIEKGGGILIKEVRT